MRLHARPGKRFRSCRGIQAAAASGQFYHLGQYGGRSMTDTMSKVLPRGKPLRHHTGVWIVLREQLRFALNKLIHSALSHILYGTAPVIREIGADGILREIQIVRRGTVVGALEYFAAKDERGTWRGGHAPCSYLHRVITDNSASDRQKLRITRQLIAQLPGNVLFGLTAGPHAEDIEILKRAFQGAGFRTWQQTTFVYSPPNDSGDLIASMKGARLRTALRAARRDLDVIEISPTQFIRYFVDNLQRAGKRNYCSPSLDHALLSDAVNRQPPQARIVAARRKGVEENTLESRLESAIALTWGGDGLVKLFRVTYDPCGHPHGTKLLILEGAETAACQGMHLDTDAATEGGKTLYQRFGSFRAHTRHEFVRYPLDWYFDKSFPRLATQLRQLSGQYS